MNKNLQNTGLIYIFTGEGKGKTSAALGTAARALAHGWTVQWVAFYKQASWGISEYALPDLLKSEHTARLQMHILGKGFFIRTPEKTLNRDGKTVKLATTHTAKVIDTHAEDEHHQAAQLALDTALQLVRDQTGNVLILDEVCNAIADGLIPESGLLDLLQQRGVMHIVLTGRFASPSLIAAADLVSSIEKVKHPYDSGKLAVKGLDF